LCPPPLSTPHLHSSPTRRSSDLSYPSSLDGLIRSTGAAGWSGPYLKKNAIPLDPWNHAYNYKCCPGEHGDYDLWSDGVVPRVERSEEHTSELQSRRDLVCRLLLE